MVLDVMVHLLLEVYWCFPDTSQMYSFDFTESLHFYQRTHVGGGEDPCVSGEI